ncbi:MAG: ribosome maturation factor [Sphingobacteriales bacterium]|nr:MAG: ribosome maturation factor [Sphingobacteriales bacterium]
MTNEAIIAKVHSLLEPLMDDTDLFVTSIQVKPTANIKVFIDADSGLTVEKSIRVNRKLRAAIEEAAMFPEGDFSLEVSSPGIGEPLTTHRQYLKNIDRLLEVEKTDGTIVTGLLRAFADDTLTLEVKGTKKLPPHEVAIPLADVKTATVQVVF